MSTKTKAATKTKSRTKKDYENEAVIPIQSLGKLVDMQFNGKKICGILANIYKTKNSAIVKFSDGTSSPLPELLNANVTITDARTQDTPSAVSPDDDFDTPEDDEDDE